MKRNGRCVQPISFPDIMLWTRLLRRAASTDRSAASLVRLYCQQGLEQDEEKESAERKLAKSLRKEKR
jgi:hypothetical protein